MFGNPRPIRRTSRRPSRRNGAEPHANLAGFAKLLLVLLGAAATTGITLIERQPFAYRLGQRPSREIRAKVDFEKVDELQTEYRRELASEAVAPIYVNRPEPIDKLRQALVALLDQIAATDALQKLPAQTVSDWSLGEPTFASLRAAVTNADQRKRTEAAIQPVFDSLRLRGVLALGEPSEARSTPREIQVENPGSERRGRFALDEVHRERLVDPKGKLAAQLGAALQPPELAESLFVAIAAGLRRTPATLELDVAATDAARETARRSVPPVVTQFKRGTRLVDQDERIDEEKLDLLLREHAAQLARWRSTDIARRLVSLGGLVLALHVLACYYVVRFERKAAGSVLRVALLVLLVMGSLGLARVFGHDPWRAESVPLTLAAMVVAIEYSQQFALLVGFGLGLCAAWMFGTGVSDLVVLTGTIAAAVLAMTRIRSRTKLIYVGLLTGLTHFALTWATGLAGSQPTDILLWDSVRRFGWGVLTGFLMGGSLPFLESVFGIVTDISLLELGDVTHPLLQELVRRAQGTYGHSVSVATLAEAAAERIGANALLVRVGAYFHDIGKMLKPHYFIENQQDSVNRHESLNPAMSTLIIIGHVKDGVDLAQQHHLPQPIVDFIEQHHGTTLVEYFYNEASREAAGDWERESECDEASFRYPGPKPQTREAGILMLADAVESASRSLDDLTPARVEGLVHDIALRRLLDGQFDECDLTLREIRLIEESLMKSVISLYHARIKYPEKRPA